jgi:hypothetical protein
LLLWTLLFVAAAYGSIVFSAQDFIHRDGLYLPHAGTLYGRDFTNLYFGGRAAWFDGLNVYSLADYQAALSRAGIKAGQNYSYPPVTLALGALLSLLPYLFALSLWSLAGLACFLLAARPYVRFAWPWLLLLPGCAAIPNGQYGLFTAALWLWSFRGSGTAAGLLTVKPHLGLLMAPTLALRGRWRQAAVAAAVGLALWGLGEYLFGLTRAFFEQGARIQARVLLTPTAEPYFAAMPSTFVRLRQFAFAWPAHIAVAGVTVAMLWPLRHQPLRRLAFPLATATFLILPYSFAYDMAVVSLGFAVLIDDRWGDLGWTGRAAALAGFAAPLVPAFAPPLLRAGLWVQRKALLATTAPER